MLPLGTLVNAGAILIGGTVGMIVRSRLPERISLIVFQGIGLFTLSLGISLAIKTQNFLLLIFSIVLGSIIGEGLNLEKGLNHLGEKLRVLINPKTTVLLKV